MPQWLKVLLLMAAAGILTLALLVGGVVWWAMANKDKILEAGRVGPEEGRRFGSTHSMSECMDDSLAQLDHCGAVDLMCETGARMRLGACLSVARDDGTCKGVPAQPEIFKLAAWSVEACRRHGHETQACTRVLRGALEGCAKRSPEGNPASAQ